MLQLDLSDLAWTDEEALARRLRDSSESLRVTATVAQVYQAQSMRDVADNWLKVWFVAESLAECAKTVSCSFREGELGAGEFILDFKDIDPEGMSLKLLGFAGVFDPDDLEAGALIYDEADEWLAKRGDSPARFPEIEEAYRTDAAHAAELQDDSFEDDE